MKNFLYLFIIIFTSTIFSSTSTIDILQPHCVIEQVIGIWELSITTQDKSREEVITLCTPDSEIIPIRKFQVELKLPNIVVNVESQVEGTWTMVDDVAVEIKIDGNVYTQFFQYKKSFWGKVTSFCDLTWVSVFHELENIPAVKWGCFKSVKSNSTMFKDVKMTHEYFLTPKKETPFGTGRKFEDFRMIDQKKHMEFFKKYRKTYKINDLPDSFDWRKMNGTSYVPYVDDQGQCGSCYIFSALGSLEARRRVQTKMQDRPGYSEQDVINCGNPTNDGCGGGFPYLVSKFATEYGIVDESCVRYNGWQSKCKDEKCERHYVKEYEYIGGYYGAASEENMMLEIYRNGPISVSFFVEDAFFQYTTGVYTCAPHKLYDANHAVVIVGWGKIGKSEGYWIVRNSWGGGWGESGYFLMRKGKNDCNIESTPVLANMIP